MNVLLVEDDRNLASAVIDYLELDNIACDYADDGVRALEMLTDQDYRVIILDINLPRKDGFSVCESLRANGNQTPVIMLTAKDRLEDKLTGFRAGTDDYLVKPFAMDELVARVMALSERISRQVKKLSVADLELNLDQNMATRNGQLLKLSPIGIKLLIQMMRASPKPVSREQLIEQVWGDEGADFNTLKVHIHKLRRDIDPDRTSPLIHTVKSIGYALRADYANQA